MTPEQWRQVTRIYGAALAQAPGKRPGFLAEACGDDKDLRREVESLLAEGSGLLVIDRPLTDVATSVLSTDSTGRTLGPYRLETLVGAGGMGHVYRATDTRLGRTVAIKVLPSALAEDPQFRARFEREAKAIAAMSHPHICTLHDVGRDAGIDYLVMEYVEGESLAVRLEGGALPFAQALTFAIEIADALTAAHRRGIVHRDLKPANVMITKSGTKLLDFGLAKAAATTSVAGSLSMLPTSPPISPAAGPLTAQGTILGTFQYMAPEQLEGKEADARTDVFAFGSLVYEMLTGKRAFEGGSQASLIGAIMHAQPAPLIDRQPLTPPGLERTVRTCLEKNPDDRWQTARDLARELRWVSDGVDQETSPRRHEEGRRRFFALAIGASLLALGVVALSIALVARKGAPVDSPVTRFSVSLPPGSRLNPSLGRVAVVSPDGRYLALVSLNRGQSQLWVHSFDSGISRPIPGTDGAIGPAWSGDSRKIAFIAVGKVKTVAIDGGPVRTICDVTPTATGLSWVPNGPILFGGSGVTRPGVNRVSEEGGAMMPLTTLDVGRHDRVHVFPTPLPDRRHFLFVAMSTDPGRSGLFAGSLDSNDTTFIMPIDSEVEYVEPGYLLFLRDTSLMAQPFSASTLTLSGEAVRVADDVVKLTNGASGFSASNNGILVHRTGVARVESDLTWFDRKGHQTKAAGLPSAPYQDIESDPDGRRLALSRLDVSSGNRDIVVYDVNSQGLQPLTFDAAEDYSPRWSSDGAFIAYASITPTGPALYRKPSRGGAAELVLDLRGGSPGVRIDDWAANPSSIIYSVVGRIHDIWMVPLTEPHAAPVPLIATNADEKEARQSPTGRWLAFTSNQTGSYQIFVRSRTNTSIEIPITTDGGIEPRWARNGRELFYLTTDGRIMSVAIDDNASEIRPGTPKELFNSQIRVPIGLSPPALSVYAVTPDDQRFAVLTPIQNQASEEAFVVMNWPALLKKP